MALRPEHDCAIKGSTSEFSWKGCTGPPCWRCRTMTRLERSRLLRSPISAVDLFCGAGGLTHGLLRAGIRVEAGVDLDPAAAHAYSKNNAGARFLKWDIARKRSPSI